MCTGAKPNAVENTVASTVKVEKDFIVRFVLAGVNARVGGIIMR